MNRKQLAILIVIVVVVGGAGWVIYRNQLASWTPGNIGIGGTLLGDFPVNDVARITIRQGTNGVNLARQEGRWLVRERGDYPANFSSISELLLKMRDLKAVQVEEVGPSQLPRLQLAAAREGTNSALAIEFKGEGDKPIHTLLLGKLHLSSRSGSPMGGPGGSWPDGRYVMAGPDAAHVALIADPLDTIEPEPARWLNKDFFRVEKAKSVEVNFPAETNSWRLTRETDSAEWNLADAKEGEELDASKIASVSNPLSSPTFTDVMPGGKLDESAANPPVVVNISTFDSFDYTIKVGQKTNDDYALTVSVAAQIPKERAPGADEKPEDRERLDKEFTEQTRKLEEKLKQEQVTANWTYLVPSWTMDPLLKERSQLLAEKKEEPAMSGNASTNAVQELMTPANQESSAPAGADFSSSP